MHQKSLLDFVNIVVEKHGCDRAKLITIMQEVQKKYRFLPKEALIQIANRLGISQAKIYGVATFYENFSLEAKGKYVLKVCDGTACHVRKSVPILQALRSELNVTEKNKTTEDRLFTLETVSCLGACGLAPVITVNDKVFPKMDPKSVVELVKKLREEDVSEN